MNIIDALAQSQQTKLINLDRKMLSDGLLSWSDAVFDVAMRELGIDKKDREEWLLEPVEHRQYYVKYWHEYEEIKKKEAFEERVAIKMDAGIAETDAIEQTLKCV